MPAEPLGDWNDSYIVKGIHLLTAHTHKMNTHTHTHTQRARTAHLQAQTLSVSLFLFICHSCWDEVSHLEGQQLEKKHTCAHTHTHIRGIRTGAHELKRVRTHTHTHTRTRTHTCPWTKAHRHKAARHSLWSIVVLIHVDSLVSFRGFLFANRWKTTTQH